MSKQDLLWEIGTEEIPARFLPDAIRQFDSLSREAFAAAGLAFDELKIYGTPRRLVLLVHGLDTRAADVELEAKGPAVKSAYDETGAPTRALLGFCKGQGVDPSEVKQKDINGSLYVFVTKTNVGCDTLAILPEMLPAIAAKIYFPKTMRWGYHACRFVRPVHWMVCLFGETMIPLQFCDMTADRFSHGHRLLGSDHIEITAPADYLELLRKNFVLVDQDERRAACWQQILAVAEAIGGRVEEDEELLEEVTHILEWPTALSGHFEDKYLAIPKELVITPMREHQRYFPVYEKEQDRLLARFITVRNGNDAHLDIVAQGNEKVLRARLADAEFFYVEDRKDKMDDKVEQLSTVVFHEKLGTLRQKVRRIGLLAEAIGRSLGYSAEELAQTQRAAYLAKADLGSRVVYEFPELQGIIGEYYAKAAGENPVVAQAIREHYQPRFAGDELPETKPGIAVSLADKLDSICGFFAIGMIPSGSQDPYALRRAASGCTQIILRNNLTLDLRALLPLAFDLIAADSPAAAAALQQKKEDLAQLDSAIRFLHQRVETILADEGISYDVLNAVSRISVAKADLAAAMRRAQVLNRYRSTEKFASLLTGFTRSANLLRAALEKYQQPLPAVNAAHFQDESEQALYDQLIAAEVQVRPNAEAGDYAAVLDAAERLTPYVNAFFEKVMVMDKDETVRNNRLALLAALVSLTAEIGDLSKIVES